MKVYIVVLFVFVKAVVFSYTQKSRNDWAPLDLVGKVKYMEECEYKPVNKNGKIVKGEKIIDDWTHFDEHYFFDKKGKLVKEEDYQNKHVLFYITTYAYGEDGKKLRKETKAMVKNRSSYTIYTYDKAGNQVGVNIYFSDSTTETYYMAFDFNGNCRYTEYYIDTIRYEKNVNTYNEKNQLVESKVFFGAWNEVPEISRFVYDDKNNLIETRYEGTESFHFIHSYNEKGQETEVRMYNDSKEGGYTGTTTYAYDVYGRVVQKTKSSADVEVKETTQYTYDKNKNWTKKIIFKNDQPVSITERKIKYY